MVQKLLTKEERRNREEESSPVPISTACELLSEGGLNISSNEIKNAVRNTSSEK